MHGLATALAVLLAADSSEAAALIARVESAPKDVESFISRRASCDHFLGEEPYDRERAAELDRVITELRCAALARDEEKLRRAYRENRGVLQLLDETVDMGAW